MEKVYLLNLASEYAKYLCDNADTILAKIYGLFSLKINQSKKFYFIIMQNLDIYPESSVIFKYDLKFSEFNRNHLNS